MLTLPAVQSTLSRPRNIQFGWRTFTISQPSRTICILPRIPLLQAIASHDSRSTAVIHTSTGHKFTYGELLHDTALAKDRLSMSAKGGSLNGKAVCFMVGRSYNYVGAQRNIYSFNPVQALTLCDALVTLLSILANQSIAVPLSATFPVTELRYLLDKCQASMLLCEEGLAPKGLDTVPVESYTEKSKGNPTVSDVKWDDAAKTKGGIMLFTSGTTSRPVR
jgi:malonyl-CoA/methylmalonyl-CoA synthetase